MPEPLDISVKLGDLTLRLTLPGRRATDGSRNRDSTSSPLKAVLPQMYP
jgi:hypothetical protein